MLSYIFRYTSCITPSEVHRPITYSGILPHYLLRNTYSITYSGTRASVTPAQVHLLRHLLMYTCTTVHSGTLTRYSGASASSPLRFTCTIAYTLQISLHIGVVITVKPTSAHISPYRTLPHQPWTRNIPSRTPLNLLLVASSPHLPLHRTTPFPPPLHLHIHMFRLPPSPSLLASYFLPRSILFTLDLPCTCPAPRCIQLIYISTLPTLDVLIYSALHMIYIAPAPSLFLCT
jgi:hypothetical protein